MSVAYADKHTHTDNTEALALFAATLAQEGVISGDQLASLTDATGPRNPISADVAVTGLGMQVYRGKIEALLAGDVDRKRLAQLLTEPTQQLHNQRQRRNADAATTAVVLPFPAANFARLQPDRLVSPEDSGVQWDLPEEIWLQRTPMTVGQWRGIATYASSLNPAETRTYETNETPIYRANEQAGYDVRGLLEYLNRQLPSDTQVHYDIPTAEELTYAVAAGLHDLYRRNPNLFTTSTPSMFDLQAHTRYGAPLPVIEAPFIDRYSGIKLDDLNLKDGKPPLSVQDHEIWGLLGSVKTLCWRYIPNHNPETTYLGISDLEDLKLYTGTNRSSLNLYRRPFEYWQHIFSNAFDNAPRHYRGLRLVLRNAGSRLRYKDL